MSPETTTNAVLDAALAYAARGLSVIPIHPRGKRPLLAWAASQDRPATVETLTTWLTASPTANLGVVTGAVSGIVVFDIDSADAWDFFCALGVAALEDGRGPWVARTARGFHVYYHLAHPGRVVRSRIGVMAGVDLRGDGGYVVAPPSTHPSGAIYTWLVPPGFLPLAELPDVLRILLASSANGNGRLAPGLAMEHATVIPEGTRNDALYRQARSRLARGASPETMKAVLLATNAAWCRPPLSEAEVVQIADRAAIEPHRGDFVTGMDDAEAAAHAEGPRARRQIPATDAPAPAVASVSASSFLDAPAKAAGAVRGDAHGGGR